MNSNNLTAKLNSMFFTDVLRSRPSPSSVLSLVLNHSVVGTIKKAGGRRAGYKRDPGNPGQDPAPAKLPFDRLLHVTGYAVSGNEYDSTLLVL